MLELVGDFFGRKKECVVAGISGGEPPWAHEAGGRAHGGGHALDPRGQVLAPLLCSQCQIFSNIPEKIILIWQAFGELLFSGYFYIARIIQKTDRKYLFYFIYSK